MEKIINFGFKIGASEIVFKNDGCQLVFTRAIDAREVYALVVLLDNHYRDCEIRIDRALINRDELLITVSPIICK